MARKFKKELTDHCGKLIYRKEGLEVRLLENALSFVINDSVINKETVTCDYSESVAIAMKLPNVFNDKKFWEIKIKEKFENINLENTLYWLTGGDLEWQINKRYKHKWEDVKEIYLYNYSDQLIDVINKARTLGDLKRSFIRFFNLPTLYEFSLKNDII